MHLTFTQTPLRTTLSPNNRAVMSSVADVLGNTVMVDYLSQEEPKETGVGDMKRGSG